MKKNSTNVIIDAEIIEDNMYTAEQRKSEQLFESMLQAYSDKSEDENVNTFLEKQLQFNNVYDTQKSKQVVQEISDTVELINEKHMDLLRSKKAGNSTASWLQEDLTKIAKTYNVENVGELMYEVREGLNDANLGTLKDVMEKDFKLSKPDLEGLKELKTINSKFVMETAKEIKENTILAAVKMEGLKIAIDPNHTEIRAVKDYFKRELYDPKDKEITKVAATGLVTIREKNWAPLLNGKSNSELATMADRGLTFAKVAYKVAKGDISPTIATDIIIDRTVAGVSTVVTKACATAGGKIGGVVGGAIGSVFGPAGTAAGTVVGTFVGKVAGTGVGMAISNGARKVGQVAKKAAEKVWSGVKNTISSVASSASNFFSKLFG